MNFENEMDMDNVIELIDENGDPVRMEILDILCFKDREFVVMLPVESEDGAVVILEIEDAGKDSETLVSVEDDALVAVLFRIFREKHADEFHFED